jgi:methionine-rich copper-binding protein CopC
MPRPLRRAMSAGLVTLLATAGVAGLGASAASADSTQTFTGTLAAGDPAWERPDGCTLPADAFAESQFFDAQAFTVPETGGYTLEMTEGDGDGYFYLYEGAFDPASPTTNCLDYDDDSGEANLPRINRQLVAGAQYTLVTTQYSRTVENTVPFTYTTTVSGLLPTVTLGLPEGQPRVVAPGTPTRVSVTFSAPVTGFDAVDVDLFTRSGASPDFTVSGSGASYVIDIAASDDLERVFVSIPEGAAETEAGLPTLSSTDFDVFTGVPVSVTPVSPSTTTGPAVFDVVFATEVQDLTVADLIVGGTAGAALVELAGEGTTYRVTVTPANAGTVELTVPELAAFAFFGFGEGGTAQLPNVASNTASVAFAPAAPSVTVEQAPEQGDPTTTLPVAFDVRFSEPIDELQASDVVLGGTAGATTVSVEAVAGDAPNTAYRVTVLDAAQAGTITVSIPAGAVTNQNLVGNTASTSVDNVVTYAPVVAPAPTAPPVAGAGGTLPETGAEPGVLLALAAMLLVAVGAVTARRSARVTR